MSPKVRVSTLAFPFCPCHPTRGSCRKFWKIPSFRVPFMCRIYKFYSGAYRSLSSWSIFPGLPHLVSVTNDVELLECYSFQRRFFAIFWLDKSTAVRNAPVFFFSNSRIRLMQNHNYDPPRILAYSYHQPFVSPRYFVGLSKEWLGDTLCSTGCRGVPALAWHDWPHDLLFLP